MSDCQPSRCPVCGGSGQVPHSFYNPPNPYSTSITVDAGQVVCRSCGGSGVLWPPKEFDWTFSCPSFDLSFDWSDLGSHEQPATGHITLVDGEGNIVQEGDLEFSPGIEPAVPHDDLEIVEEITDDAYTYRLLNPDGSEAAPPLIFHKGSPEEGWHGWTTAHVLAALVKHMEFHQSTAFACDENQVVLDSLRAAHRATVIRADRRKERGVLYDWRKP